MPVTIRRITNGLLVFNKPLIFPKIVVEESFFIVTSFTKNIKIITAIAPGIREKRNTVLISIACKIAKATIGPAIAPI